jgi:LacI family transcriptional regulator
VTKGRSIREVAEAVGASVSTVSKALNGRYGVREELRQRIVEMARELGFQPNAQARSLAMARTQSIGFLIAQGPVPLPSNPFYSHVWEGALRECLNQGYNLTASLIPLDVTRDTFPRLVSERWVDAVLLVGPVPDLVVPFLLRQNVHVIAVDPGRAQEGVTTVTMANESGAYDAVHHLTSLGHRRIGVLAGSPDRLSYAQRVDGYRRALVEAGLEVDVSLIAADARNAFDQTIELLRLDRPPTAIFAANDTRALYALRAISESGLRVPDDVSLVGFDDLPFAASLTPPLTTVCSPKTELGEVAVRLAVETVDSGVGQAKDIAVNAKVHAAPDDTSDGARYVLPTSLIVRASSAAPRYDPAAAPRESARAATLAEQHKERKGREEGRSRWGRLTDG